MCSLASSFRPLIVFPCVIFSIWRAFAWVVCFGIPFVALFFSSHLLTTLVDLVPPPFYVLTTPRERRRGSMEPGFVLFFTSHTSFLVPPRTPFLLSTSPILRQMANLERTARASAGCLSCWSFPQCCPIPKVFCIVSVHIIFFLHLFLLGGGAPGGAPSLWSGTPFV